eukprot:gene23566-9090_t
MNVQLRFRHSNGDIGPFTFSESALVESVKETLLAAWPKDGPLAQEVPQQTGDIKLILSGKWCEGVKHLSDYRREMGEIKPDSVVTMLVVIRPSQPAVSGSQGSQGERSKPDTVVTMLVVIRPSQPAVSGSQGGTAKTESDPQKEGCACVIC